MLVFKQLPIIFPWYDRLQKQVRYRENVGKVCDYKLITPNDALLPFQFRRSFSLSTPTSWKIFEVNTNVEVRNITTSLGDLKTKPAEAQNYFYYSGVPLTVSGIPIVPLPFGFYYSVIQFSDTTSFYSEVFHIPADSFSITPIMVGNYTDMNYIRLQFWNNCDLRPILYNDLVGGDSVFKQTVYLDTILTSTEPELFVDGAKDGNDVVIPTFQRLVIKHRISNLVSDYLKVALHLLPLHEKLSIVLHQGLDYGDIDKISIQSTVEASGALSMVEMLWEQELAVVKTGCCDNMQENLPEGNGRLLESGDFRLLENGDFRLLE